MWRQICMFDTYHASVESEVNVCDPGGRALHSREIREEIR